MAFILWFLLIRSKGRETQACICLQNYISPLYTSESIRIEDRMWNTLQLQSFDHLLGAKHPTCMRHPCMRIVSGQYMRICKYGATTHWSLGWNWSLRIGEGKRNLWSQSPVSTSHKDTMLSVEALTSLCPSRLQLLKQQTSDTQHLRKADEIFTV